MRVLFPAAAAFAASVLATDANAKAVADLPPQSEAVTNYADHQSATELEAEIERQREINNTAASVLCDQLTILSGTNTPMRAEWPVDGGTTAYPHVFNFANSAITFPPYNPASGKAPDVIIHWPDLVELDALGEEHIVEGKDQHIVLQEQSLTDVPYFTTGFVADALTEDITHNLQCFAEAFEQEGVLTRSVSCTDHIGQMSIVEFSPGQVTLSHFFDIMTSPITPMRLGCTWGVDLRRPEAAPEAP